MKNDLTTGMEETTVMMDEPTARLFVLFQRHREKFDILLNSGMFESPFSRWELCFNGEGVLTYVKETERMAYRR